MDEMKKEINNEIEIDLQRVLGAVLNKAWLVAIVAVVCAVLTFLGTFLFITPKYQSSVMLYVNNSIPSNLIDGITSITSGDLSTSRGLVKSYIVILNTRETLNAVIDYAGVDRSYGQVKGMISAAAVDSTEIFRVIVTSDDPKEAEQIADAISYILPKQINSIIEGTSAKIVDSAILPTSPSSPNYTKNTVMGFLIGLLAVVAIVALRTIFDNTIRTEEDVTQKSNYPLLAAVPDMEAQSKGGYYYGYRKSAYDKTKAVEGAKTVLVGSNINFAASEAYKLLRTKLQFSFADETNGCKVIGVSSAMTGEGKSLTTVNLAYSLSLLGKRVLLIDSDMRRPSICDKLPIHNDPGLSEFLSGQVQAENLIQFCGLEEDASAFHVIASGHIPPNPMELLSSTRMAKSLNKLRGTYDYILLDLPPVGEVGDALAVAKYTDGLLLVVRQDYCNRLALSAALRQFEFVETKILGLVLNCATEDSAGYGKKYYKKYGKQYYKGYKYAYASADKSNKQNP